MVEDGVVWTLCESLIEVYSYLMCFFVLYMTSYDTECHGLDSSAGSNVFKRRLSFVLSCVCVCVREYVCVCVTVLQNVALVITTHRKHGPGRVAHLHGAHIWL